MRIRIWRSVTASKPSSTRRATVTLNLFCSEPRTRLLFALHILAILKTQPLYFATFAKGRDSHYCVVKLPSFALNGMMQLRSLRVPLTLTV
jgi:hypothetical protein